VRTTSDQIRHAICFELIGLLIVTPIGAWALDKPFADIGIIGIICATVATGWTYFYNRLFDRVLMKWSGKTNKGLLTRVVHAVCFEAGLLVVLMPIIAVYLEITLLEALMVDLSFTFFYMVYAFVFNWAYDQMVPVEGRSPSG